MHYEENDSRHPRHREQPHQQRWEQRQPYQEDHFNDFRSRWGDPAPIFSPRRNEWRSSQENHPPGEGRLHDRREGPPNQHWQDRGDRQRDYNDRPPVWMQQDTHFHSSNQHANNRWQYDHGTPNHNYRHGRQLPPDDYWDDRLR